ncbi:hypothetical protein DPMN_108869 [Dreissena polymorpha]|uniref:Uncharacterized protein n=1 Tax=Dreissena polymorpha TaxID=45954 RepID=A0A9D4QLE5_DREPO|nr:hypothetical protein DPMN_108869 [Dreissena polymorpha]
MMPCKDSSQNIIGHITKGTIGNYLSLDMKLLAINPCLLGVRPDSQFAQTVSSPSQFAQTVSSPRQSVRTTYFITLAHSATLFDTYVIHFKSHYTILNSDPMKNKRAKMALVRSPEKSFTLHKLADMRRTGVGKPRPLLDQEKLDLFRVAKKFDRLVADVERKMRAAHRRLKEMLTGLD